MTEEHSAEKDAASAEDSWEEAGRAGWLRTADRWDPATLTLRPIPPSK